MEIQLADELIDFIHKSPTPFHVVENAGRELLACGFTQLSLGDAWNIGKGGRYFVTKNSSSLFAFEVGTSDVTEGIKLIAAHSDSPAIRIKPNPEILVEGRCLKLNTEVYGSPIINTWFDRPLSLAGRVMLRGADPLWPEMRLVDFRRPMLVIPSLAVHFGSPADRSAGLGRQKEMLPLMAMTDNAPCSYGLMLHMLAEELDVCREEILDFNLTLYEYERGCLFGARNEFISGGRLDDLSMAFAGLKALTGSPACSRTRMLALFDNEEVGSLTAQGAGSPVLRNIVQRMVTALGGNGEDLFRTVHNSFMVSADMAHALHPNYAERHDPTNRPLLNGGPVIKYNANRKYITDEDSAAVFMEICRMAGVPCQQFVNHSDMEGGSTLGRILLSQMEMRGVDIGNPMLGMHSIRETAGVMDQTYAVKAFSQFYSL